MGDVRERTEALLEEKPEAEQALKEVLTVDEHDHPWTFDDVNIDSGTFGEIVSRDIVSEVDGGYRLTDNTETRIAVGEESEDEPSGSKLSVSELPAVLPNIQQREAALVSFVLIIAFIARVFVFQDVFRSGELVFLGNDAHSFRAWTTWLVQNTNSPFETSILGQLPKAGVIKKPLFIFTMWWLSELLGGTAWAAGIVLAVYPVAAGLLNTIIIYFIGKRLADDWGVGFCAGLVLAITPTHALRTALGFADHHAFDYVWLALTALLLVELADDGLSDLRTRRGILLTIGLSGVVTAQTLSWDASPLLLAPIALYVAVRVLRASYTETAPTTGVVGVLVATGVSGVISVGIHLAFNILPFTAVGAPLLICVGGGILLIFATIGTRFGLSKWFVPTITAVAGVSGLLLITIVPPFSTYAERGISYFLARRGAAIAETLPLFSQDPIVTPIIHFGLFLYVAIPVLGWVTWLAVRRTQPKWLVPVLYGWYFFLLTAILQRRFAPELSLFTAIFTAVALLKLAQQVDLIEDVDPFQALPHKGEQRRIEVPDRRTIGNMVLLFMLLSGLSVIQVPVHINKVILQDDTVQTGQALNERTAELGLQYPDNYVFSPWSENIFFNFRVANISQGSRWVPRGYGYAQTYYANFSTSTRPAVWYQQLQDRPGFPGETRFVVTSDQNGKFEPQSVQRRLHDQFGSRENGHPGVAHYRAFYASPDGSVKSFELVPGATITGRNASNQTVNVETSVSIPGADFQYARQAEVTRGGWFAVTVPYPGKYRIDTETIHIPEDAVHSGRQVRNFSPNGSSRWSFEQDQGATVFDTWSGYHGTLTGASRTSSDSGTTMQFDGVDDRIRIDYTPLGETTRSLSLSLQLQTGDGKEFDDAVIRPLSTAPTSPHDETDGVEIALDSGHLVGVLGNGSVARVLEGPRIDDGDKHHVAMTWNGTMATLYLDGERVDQGTYQGTLTGTNPLVLGASASNRQHFPGTLDDVQLYNHSTERVHTAGDQ